MPEIENTIFNEEAARAFKESRGKPPDSSEENSSYPDSEFLGQFAGALKALAFAPPAGIGILIGIQYAASALSSLFTPAEPTPKQLAQPPAHVQPAQSPHP